ncbi:hypothetical protein GCM10008022_21690 [Paenibacillus hunanensis]|nr:hypothetical protein GCM10008022_21690 [Paenibacillus hunanensis]
MDLLFIFHEWKRLAERGGSSSMLIPHYLYTGSSMAVLFKYDDYEKMNGFRYKLYSDTIDKD